MKIFVAALAFIFASLAFADYPEKSIRLVVPFATGGTSEIIARSVASSLSTSLGQSVYVDNKPGGAGNIAMEEVKRANPDGYTLILGHVGPLAVNPALFGQIQATFNGMPSLMGQIKGGALRPLAVGSLERSKVLPNVPTIAESGYKGFETSQWYGIMAPAGTPQPVIDRLQKEIAKSLKSKEDSKKMLDDGAVLVGDTPAQFGAFIKSEQSRWAKVVEKAKITVD